VVTLEHNLTAKSVTFLVNSAPPFTLYNVSDSAVPFLNVLWANDTVSLVSGRDHPVSNSTLVLTLISIIPDSTLVMSITD
jgi:hypothetical protein